MKLAAQKLSFGYPEHPVGRDVSLAVEPGDVLCLLGPNGCGKTTLFKTLLGLLRPQSGQVSIGGDDLASLARSEVARRIAYVPQATAIPFPYTAHDVVLMARIAHRGVFTGPTAADREAAHTALADLGIVHLGDHDVTRLSGGQRQLVMIARALAQAAPFIVMDEPTASLDFGNQLTVLSQIRRIADRGAGVILSTHDPNHAFAVATRVALMREGRLVATGTPAAVLTGTTLRDVYGVPVDVETLPSGRAVCVAASSGAAT